MAVADARGAVVVQADSSTTPIPGLAGWSVSEEATPLTPDDTSGAVGGFSLQIDNRIPPHEIKAWRRKTVHLDDLGQGRTTGRVESVGSSQGVPTVTLQSRLNLLAVQRNASPYTGDMLGYLTYLLALCGIRDMTTVYVDPDLALATVALPGWYQPVWTQLKKLAAIYHFEIALASDKIIFRKLRERTAQQYRDSQVDWAIDDSNLAQSVVVNYYETIVLNPGDYTNDPTDDHAGEPGYVYLGSKDGSGLGGIMEPSYEQAMTLGLVYPAGGWSEQVEILTVNANEVKEVQIDLGASVSYIMQPQPTYFVGAFQVPGTSVYTISDRNGNLVAPAEWTRNGGRVTVKINPDHVTATLTLRGCGEGFKGPFSLSLHGSANDFSTLRLIGQGIGFRKLAITAYTGVSDDQAQADVGVTVDNEFVTSEAEAWEVMARVLPRYAGPRQTITVNSEGINRLGDSGTYHFQPVSWLEQQIPAGTTVSTLGDWLNSQSGGTTLRDVSAWIASQSTDDFTNQAFGNVAGARVKFDGSWYRITSATIQPSGISYSAALDMTCGDISAELAPTATVADFTAAFAGKTLRDWDARPVPESLSA